MPSFPSERIPAILALEDGAVWRGFSCGATADSTGEVVFNTSMTGYQEVLTDPSYCRQIVVMTVSHIGNTGVNAEDPESARLWLSGFAFREESPAVSNWRAETSVDAYLREHGVTGISGIDTRSLVRHIRSKGAMRGAVSATDPDPDRLVALARASASMNGADLAREVTCGERYPWTTAGDAHWSIFAPEAKAAKPLHVALLDFGIKHNTMRELVTRGCTVTVLPASSTAEDVLALAPDGVLLSNGPGDPAAVTYAIDTIRALLGLVPIMGICLGHQLLGLALGGDTYKLKFGHRGGNQPVKNLVNSQTQITSHNHGFAVRAESLPAGVEVTHVNLNDQCVEGLRAPALRAFSVQFHPEAAPGPHDAAGLFDDFIRMMEDAHA